MNRNVWLLLSGIAVTAGCAHFQPAPLAPEKSAAAYDARRLDDPGLRTFFATSTGHAPAEWPLARWNLNSLTVAAFYFHPDLAVARAQWQLAEAGLLTAAARPNPSLSFSPSYDTQIPDNPSPWMIPVTLDIPIETAGKRAKRIAEAEKTAESARWSFVSAAWQVRANVRASLLDYNYAGRRAELLDKEFAAETNIVNSLSDQLKAGAIARPDVTLAQLALHKTQIDLSDAKSKQADARIRLAQALGVSPMALQGVKLPSHFPATAPASVTSAQARMVALRERADIRGALADYAVSQAGLQLQIAKQYPDLHLGPGYAWNQGNAGDNEWTLGATLELPILDQNQGPIAQARAQRRLSAAKFLALQAQVEAQIDRALAELRVAETQVKTGREMIQAEQEQLKSAQAQVQAGAAARSDLLNAQIESANAALTQLDNENRLQSAIGALEDAVQSPADQIAAVIQKLASENSQTNSQHP